MSSKHGWRSVLVFFEDSDHLREFELFASSKLPSDSRHILDGTRTTRDEADVIIEKRAGEPSAITLATAAYGRGEDFKYSGPVLKAGGGHAIQLFWSDNPAEELQIRGRIARKADRGSYELMVDMESLKVKFRSVSECFTAFEEKKKSMCATRMYDEVDLLRQEMSKKEFVRRKEMCEKALDTHERTLRLLKGLCDLFNAGGVPSFRDVVRLSDRCLRG